MIHFRLFLISTLLGLTASALADEAEGARRVRFLNYPDCIELRNEVGTVAVLGHHVGGRVLSYSHRGAESLYLSPDENAWSPGGEARPSSAGRFDIGPEYLVPPRPELWSGEWQSEITGPRSARLTSQPSAAAGVRLIREFRLEPLTSHLECTQIIENTSDQVQSWCHWGRMFAVHGGIGVVPLTPERQRFPNGYIMMRGRDEMLILPEDENVRRRGDFIEILAPPAEPKLGFDSFAGWFAYQMPNDLAFVKTYHTYPDRLYGEVAGLTLSIWYPSADKIPACELEPIGPMEVIAPGESAHFTEHWHLIENQFPHGDEALDLQALADKVGALEYGPPRWRFLGDDEALTSTFDDAENVVLLCQIDTELERVKPPFAEVIYHGTVVETLKGDLQVGQKIKVGFATDGLPVDPLEREKFVESRNRSSKGALRFVFLDPPKDGVYGCDWTQVPLYEEDLHRFLRGLAARPRISPPPAAAPAPD